MGRRAQFTTYRTIQNASATNGYTLLGHTSGTEAGNAACYPIQPGTPAGPSRFLFAKQGYFVGNVTDPDTPGRTYSLYAAPGWTSIVQSAVLAVDWSAPAPGTNSATGPQRLASLTVNLGAGAFSPLVKSAVMTVAPTVLLAWDVDGVVPASAFELPSTCGSQAAS